MKKLLVVIFICASLSIQGQEIVTLGTPITKPTQVNVRIRALHLYIFPTKTVVVEFTGNNGEDGTAYYPTPAPPDHPSQPTGAALMTTLNTANLTSNSLMRRTLTRLQTDGYIPAGTISGAPE